MNAAERVDALAPFGQDPGFPYNISFDEIYATALFMTAVYRSETGEATPEEIRMLQRALGMAVVQFQDAGILDKLCALLAVLQFNAKQFSVAEASAMLGLREAERSGDEGMIQSIQGNLDRIQSEGNSEGH